jgi:hypothetical protein
VGGLGGRVSRLEERRRPARPLRPERESFEDWQLRAETERNRKTPPSVKVASVKLRWLRRVGKFSDFESAQELIQDIMQGPDGSGAMLPPSGRSSVLVRREVYFAIWRGAEGMTHLATQVLPEWAEVFTAAEEWREKMISIPTEVLARWVIACRPLIERYPVGEDGEIDQVCEEFLGPYGIDESLLEGVVGRGVFDLTPEETGWLVYAPLADDYCSQWCWTVHQEVHRLDEIEGGN